MTTTRTRGGRLERQAVHSFLWAGSSFAANKIVVLAGTVVLARILVPADFGLVAAAMTVLTLMEMALDLGVGSAVIFEQERGHSERVRTAFTLSVWVGTGLTVLGVLAAPWIAQLFQAPNETALFRAMFGYLLLRGFSQVPDAILRRDLAYRKRFMPDVARALVRVGIAIPLALAGHGAWSIVIGMLAGETVGTVLTFVVARFRPLLRLARGAIADLMHFGLAMVGVRIVAEIGINADFLIVGNRLGPSELGIYSVAYRLPELAITSVFWVFSNIAFPVFSQARADGGTQRLRSGVLTSMRMGTMFAFPAATGLALVADDTVALLFGPQWEAAVAPLAFIAASVGVGAVARVSGNVLPAIGRPGLLLGVNLAVTLPMVAAMVWATRYGIVGVAIAHLGGVCLHTMVHQWVVNRALGLSWRELGHAVRGGVGCAIGVAIAVLPVLQMLTPGLPRLLSALVAGVVGGAAGLRAVDSTAMVELRRLTTAGMRS